ncbi:MAG: GNAT family N-acetyltransferase [Martelella sp.]|uniref:GNAT family N-acetyltransferase n=1 Tax=Martelella sp. TaxID=1969699 RepID=UPI000C4E000C|nr:GNAT family N-acetyltransferase [Martelella sp.]MAU20333.1 GNAT family N-acetyltransferase [Martelella sp.]
MLIREGKAEDLEALYAIALLTGDTGQDASPLYDDPHMIGHIYAAPYLMVDGGFCLVAEDEAGGCGYVVGTADTEAFARTLETDWWPALRKRYPEPDAESRAQWSPDEWRAHLFHHPEAPPPAVVEAYPAHLHMNLLARARGHGLGRQLLGAALRHLTELGASHVHVGAGWTEAGGAAFWQACGFAVLEEAGRTVYLGRAVA